jgi:hypothetical protein
MKHRGMDLGRKLFYESLFCQRGVIAPLMALLILVMLGFVAISVDTSHLVVVRNELKNASDAGALRGARVLYNHDGTVIDPAANQEAYDTAMVNRSDKLPVDVHWTAGNSGDVQRGHWSFATRTFTPNDSLDPVDLWDVTTAELDADIDFINAVRVITRREDTPANSFFATLLGQDSFVLQNQSVAYIGFAGTIDPYGADMPIAICYASLLTVDDEYTCTVGRMINSSGDPATSETGGWTSFYQGPDSDPEAACLGGTNANEVKTIIDPPGPENCFGENEDPLIFGRDMATMGGEAETALAKLRVCWEEESEGKTQPWPLTLPVINCESSNVGPCDELRGVVEINVLWITGPGDDPHYDEAPWEMGPWSSADPDGVARWNSFQAFYNLQNADGSPAPYEKKSLYFQPSCTYHEPVGATGGYNYGILARIPKLVQ